MTVAGCFRYWHARLGRNRRSYGIRPAGSREDFTNFGAHSDVERLAESSIYPFVQFVWSAVTGIAGGQK